jgi:Domain of unknown function (DUF4338)/Transposase DNA-binding/Transposase Tn5 dimerisation domain
MEVQSQIKRSLSAPQALDQIRLLLAGGQVADRTGLARAVCERFGFYDACGRAQVVGCLKALRDLERGGRIELPAARSCPSKGSARRLESAVPWPVGVPPQAQAVRGLELVLVETDEQMRTWNELMIREHPQGAGPLVGAQLRYLIESDHGYLGGFGFSAAALALADRDRWIGWDAETRLAQLHRVVNLSRFLIRERGCFNLASQVMGAMLRRLPVDFERRFGYRPYVVESFVDTSSHEGTCYRASNWVEVGQTRGRGRQDRDHAGNAGIKAIYVYLLVSDFRDRLGVVLPEAAGPLEPGEGLDSAHWAEQEFGGAALGDARLSRRLVMSAKRQAEQPGRAFPGAAGGDRAATKGYYRLIDHPDVEAVTMAAILEPHRQSTLRRMAGEGRVLCVVDGTDLDYTGLVECEGLGASICNQTGAQARSLHLHSTLAINAQGIPLGIVDVGCRTPDPQAPKKPAKSTPIEEKKTFEWIRSLQACAAAAKQMPETRIICVMDREADFYELFDARREDPCVDLLVRAKWNRRTAAHLPLFDRLRSAEKRGEVTLTIKRQSTRPKRSKQKARPGRQARRATLELHYERIELAPPDYLRQRNPISLWAVHGVEKKPPAEAKPVEWFLVTSREVTSAADARQCLDDYARRWRIEDWHRVIKSGCHIEELSYDTVDRLKRALAIKLVIGWRIMVMTLLGREVPELPAEILFTDLEIEVLTAWAKANRAKIPAQLGDAIRLVARFGGYLTHTRDPPGHQLMWYGYQYLYNLCIGYELRAT